MSEKAGHQTSAESWGTGKSQMALQSRRVDADPTKVVLLPVFLVSLEAVLTVPARQLLATCADLDVCLHRRRCGVGGTKRSISTRSK